MPWATPDSFEQASLEREIAVSPEATPDSDSESSSESSSDSSSDSEIVFDSPETFHNWSLLLHSDTYIDYLRKGDRGIPAADLPPALRHGDVAIREIKRVNARAVLHPLRELPSILKEAVLGLPHSDCLVFLMEDIASVRRRVKLAVELQEWFLGVCAERKAVLAERKKEEKRKAKAAKGLLAGMERVTWSARLRSLVSKH